MHIQIGRPCGNPHRFDIRLIEKETERLPGRLAPALRNRLDPMLSQDAVVPFLGTEHPVPAHDRVRRDDRVNRSDHRSPKDLPFNRRASLLVVVEPDPFPAAMRFTQGLVLGAQVLDDLLLLPVDPSRRDVKEEPPRA